MASRSNSWLRQRTQEGDDSVATEHDLPADLEPASTNVMHGNIDRIALDDGYVVGAGWVWTDADVAITVDGQPTESLVSIPRPDVAAGFGVPIEEVTGWLVVTAATPTSEIAVRVDRGGQRHWLTMPKLDHAGALMAEHAPRAGLILDAVGWSAVWTRAAVPFLERAHGDGLGRVEWAAANDAGAIVAGWAPESAESWHVLVDDAIDGAVVRLDQAFRFPRPDVDAALGASSGRAGWILRWPAHRRAEGEVWLIARSGQRAQVVSAAGWEALPADPRTAAQRMFGAAPLDGIVRRLSAVDGDIVLSLQSRRAVEDEELGCDEWWVGPPHEALRSVIIPLYGRWDFIHHHLLRFGFQEGFGESTEVIFVVDDPMILAPLLAERDLLFQLYAVPFRIISGRVNRGFGGANNLGASRAQGEVLIFLNSDCFPETRDWATRMHDLLLHDEEIGAVGALLLRPDGTVQHAGMQSAYSVRWGVHLNEHPHTGLAPGDLSLSDAPFDVPAVTAALVAIPTSVFRAIGGFAAGYLIGDFEDSDLCFRIAGSGKRVVMDPNIVATHLERQSLITAGSDHFRQSVVLYNAWLHEQRWRERLVDTAEVVTP